MKTLSDFIRNAVNLYEKEDEDTENLLGGDSEEDTEKDAEEDTNDDEKDSEDETDEDTEKIDMNGFMVLKPEFTDKESDLRSRLESDDWKVVGEQEKKLSEEEAKKFYSEKEKEPYFDDLVEYMSSGKSKCFMLWKEDATDPIGELKTLKEKLRTEWTDDDLKNAIHSSDSFDAMEKELSIFLAPEEKEEDSEEEDKDKDEEKEGEDIESKSDENDEDDGDESEDTDTSDDSDDESEDLLG